MPHFPFQILVELAELQDQEVGDGTTSVVIVAAELLKRANDLVRNKIHPTSIISGFRLAMREVIYAHMLVDMLSALYRGAWPSKLFHRTTTKAPAGFNRVAGMRLGSSIVHVHLG